MTTTAFKDGFRYIEIISGSTDGYRVELPTIKNGIFTIQKIFDGSPVYEISVCHDEIDNLINGLLDAKREYRNMYE